MRPSRVFTTERKLARQLAAGVHVGDHFVYIDLDQVDQSKVSLPNSLHPRLCDPSTTPKSASRLTVPLESGQRLKFGGFSIKPAVIGSLALQCIAPDRDLYIAHRDIIHLLVVDLQRGGEPVQVELVRGTSYASVSNR